MNNKKVYLSSPHMSDENYEMEFIDEAFASNWISPLGKNVEQFEKEFAAKLGSKNAVALNTGTAAIHMSLKAAGVEKGDIVFCQSLTFAATVNPIIYQGAIPVFIDSDHKSWNMSPEYLRNAFEKYKKIGKTPKAVIVVHLYGLTADMDAIMAICNEYQVPLIEDAAEALGSLYKGKYAGTMGKYGVFSFNGNKIITTSGGGMIVSDEALEKIVFWSTQSRDKALHYQHSEIGYNYRMSNVLAGIGRGQMRVLDQRIAKKKYIFEFYKNELKDYNSITMMPINEWNQPNYWLSCFTVSGANKPLDIIEALNQENIECRPLWKPMHMQPVFDKYDFCGNNVSNNLFEHGICLPSDTKLTDEELYRVVSVIKKRWNP